MKKNDYFDNNVARKNATRAAIDSELQELIRHIVLSMADDKHLEKHIRDATRTMNILTYLIPKCSERIDIGELLGESIMALNCDREFDDPVLDPAIFEAAECGARLLVELSRAPSINAKGYQRRRQDFLNCITQISKIITTE